MEELVDPKIDFIFASCDFFIFFMRFEEEENLLSHRRAHLFHPLYPG